MTKTELIEKVLELEWEMFQKVNNEGGTASCQQNQRVFRINRSSQAYAWSEFALASYINDLIEAKKVGRNLLTEKYAWMMESTAPEEFANIKHLLPVLEEGVLAIIDKITAMILPWEEELAKKYPNVLGKGRPLYSHQDSPFATSFETYLKGELASYSLNTLKCIFENVSGQKAAGINGSEIVLENQMQQYGFADLAEANTKLQK